MRNQSFRCFKIAGQSEIHAHYQSLTGQPAICKTIVMVSQTEFSTGLCEICRERAIKKYYDTETDLFIGDCCLRHLAAAKIEIKQSLLRTRDER